MFPEDLNTNLSESEKAILHVCILRTGMHTYTYRNERKENRKQRFLFLKELLKHNTLQKLKTQNFKQPRQKSTLFPECPHLSTYGVATKGHYFLPLAASD